MSDTTRRPLDEFPGRGNDLRSERSAAPGTEPGHDDPAGVHGDRDGFRDDGFGDDGFRGDGTATGLRDDARGPRTASGGDPVSGTGRAPGHAAPDTGTGTGTAPFDDGRTGMGSGPGPGSGAGHGHTPDPRHGSGGPLLPHDDLDALTAQLQHAVTGFVDAPREAVEEADQVLQDLTARFTEAVTERRRTLRRSWQTTDGAPDTAAAATDTEQLRLALRDYRELAERLLHV
ncbi:hypothetical protein IGX29_08600 [Streptomyces sp. H28]|uniref:hypothetical protein n=1 Tax=Streptomyces sp. H28 TaxID=2775865 RepID=UPI00177F4118|nr:hypothetical protein [Streptomyces sp. H28]MBD9731878.1 hypothetical protein [Streptomyces sp. H28]